MTRSSFAGSWWNLDALRLVLCGLAILFWELVLIRWLGATLRIVAYFSNLVLISAFFGLGLGALLTRFRLRLERVVAPVLATTVLLGVWLTGLAQTNPQTKLEYIWSGTPSYLEHALAGRAVSVGVVLILTYGLTAAVFAAFGQYLGRLFRTHPPLRAYSLEVGGSLCGILLFALLSQLQASPAVWFALGFALLLAVLPWRPIDAVIVVALAGVTLVSVRDEARDHVWSPYYRISLQPIDRVFDFASRKPLRLSERAGYALTVNTDYHQMMLDLHPRSQEPVFLSAWRAFYDGPYADYPGLKPLPPGRILVVGAGSGNDVAAALRRTDRSVTAVEIDPAIADIGRRLHGERPYENPRVRVVVDDARSVFHRAPDAAYALVVFGFLDSHRLLSAFGSVRLDNFIYTEEAMAEVRRILAPGGRVALSFASDEPWIHARLKAMLDRSFGPGTRMVVDATGYAYGVLYLNARGDGDPPAASSDGPLVPSDDWPFLYLRERRIPGYSLTFLAMAIGLSALAFLVLPRGERRLRMPYLLLGAAFFLLETSNVVRMALLFGSTWWVNTVVFAGILALVLLANLTVAVRRVPIAVCIACLGAGILLAATLPSGVLLDLPTPARAVVAVIVFLGPVYFGGLIFARLIENETRLFEAYGSNVLGAVLGGTAEYVSLVLGFRFLLALALVAYLLVYLLLRRPAVATAG